MASKYISVHASPNGPGDARPTALQIIKDENLTGALTGRTVFMTGCSSGIGIETARALYTTGATLYLTARDLSKARTAIPDLLTSERVHLLQLDLNSLSGVRASAAEFLSQSKELHIFIANAGVMATPYGHTEDGFETQLGTNHLSHFLLFNLLLPSLISSASTQFNSRAIFLTSVAHRFFEPDFSNLNFEKETSYNDFAAYGASKTANLWTAIEVNRRYASQGLRALGVHPGGIDSGLSRHMSEEAAQGMRDDPFLKNAFKSPEQGAATTVWSATARVLEGKGGNYVEDCQVSRPWTEGDGQWGMGYAVWAMDEDKAGRMWDVSKEMVGLE